MTGRAKGPGVLRVQLDDLGQVGDHLFMPAHQPVRACARAEGPGVPRSSSMARDRSATASS